MLVAALVTVAACLTAIPSLFVASAGADTPSPPSVTGQPDVAIVTDLGNYTTFSATADGSPAPTIQWQESSDGITFTSLGSGVCAADAHDGGVRLDRE